MTEDEQARSAFYQAHRDDSEVWEDAASPVPRGAAAGSRPRLASGSRSTKAEIIRREARRAGLNLFRSGAAGRSRICRAGLRTEEGHRNVRCGRGIYSGPFFVDFTHWQA